MARIVGANRNEIEKKMDEIFKEAKNCKIFYKCCSNI